MLTESFIASVQGQGKKSSSSLPKDASIFLYDFQPIITLEGHFNKSTTDPNCLAVTNTHIFAAQSDSAIVQVFSRERGNQETFVPFPEHISSIAVIGREDGVSILALGTGQGKPGKDGGNGGRIMLWELATGRCVQTPPSHIQPVTCLAVDPTNNFLLSGSADSQIHVWSIPALLSPVDLDEADRHLQYAPVRTLSDHEAGITALAMGHSHMPINIAVSASRDNRCNIWDYHAGSLLRTFLMSETPLCLAIDPADRAFYAGLSSGAVQMVSFHKPYSNVHPLYDDTAPQIHLEPDKADRWFVEGTEPSPVLSLDISYDATVVLAGHESGIIYARDVGAPRSVTKVADLARPVTNLVMLPPQGFPVDKAIKSRLNRSGTRLINVVKPRPGEGNTGGHSGLYVPEGYTFTACFEEALPLGRFTDNDGKDTLLAEFEEFTAPGNPHLPEDLWEKALSELSTSSTAPTAKKGGHSSGKDANGSETSQYEVEKLKAQLSIAQKQQKALAAKLAELQPYAEPEAAANGDKKRRKR